jgi:hypothetical protein
MDLQCADYKDCIAIDDIAADEAVTRHLQLPPTR